MRREKLRLRPYRPGDFDRFTPRADFAREQEALGWPLSGDAAPPGPTWTVVRGWGAEPAVVGVGGAVDHGADGWQAWCCLADLPTRDWPQLLWLAGTVLAMLERRGARRIQAHACEGCALRCLAMLGFKFGGPDLDVLGQIYKTMIRSA